MESDYGDEFSALLSGLLRGSKADESAFFRLAWMKLIGWSRTRFFIEEKDREDFAIEVIEKALAQLPRYEKTKGAFASWLFVLARNASIDRSRRLGAGRDVLHGALHGEDLDWRHSPPAHDQPPDPDEPPSSGGTLQASLDAVLATLPDRDQELLSMAYSGVPAARIAEVLQITPANVRQRHRRLLKKLCLLLSQPKHPAHRRRPAPRLTPIEK